MPHKRPPVPVRKPPSGKPWAHAYNKRLQAMHAAWSEHVIHACKEALGTRADAFDPDEPRDEHGRWTSGPGSFAARPKGWKAAHDNVFAITRKGHLYRGMSAEEFHGIKEKGYIASDERDSFAGEGTNFAGDAETAESYANGGRADPRVTGKATYLVEVKSDKPKLASDGYYKASEKISADEITRAWRFSPEPGTSGGVDTGDLIATPVFTRKDSARSDSIVDDLVREFEPMIEALGLSKFLRRMGNSLTRQQANYLKRVAGVPVSGVAPAAKLEAWRQENLSLIKSLNAEQIQQVGDIIRPAQAQGLRWEDVADQIQERLNVGSSRARLIARDQTNKWNGAMMQQTQGDAGITQYRWSTANDQAVRGRPGGVYEKSKENHWELQNTIQSWDSPPVIPGTDVRSHPGGRIQCRCAALPIIPWLEALA